MDLIFVLMVAIGVFAVFVVATAFSLKSSMDLHKRTMDAVTSHNVKHLDDLKPEDKE